MTNSFVTNRQRPFGANPVFWGSSGIKPPTDWDVRTVKQLVTTVKGKVASRLISIPTERTAPYLMVDTLRGGNPMYTEDTHLPSASATDSILIADGFRSGDVIRGIAGVLGSTLLAVKPNASLHPSFLYHTLVSLFPYLNGAFIGTSVRHLDQNLLMRLSLAIPPPDEQAAIARILDAVDTAVERTREAIARAREVRSSLIIDLLTEGSRGEKKAKSPIGSIPSSWDCELLGDHISDGPTNGLYRPDSDYGSHGTPIVRIDSFYDGHISDLNALRRVVVDDVTVRRYELDEDDILINRVNSMSHIGKAAIVPRLSTRTLFESNVMRLRCGDRLLPGFLILILCSAIARRHWLARAKPAINQASVNQRDVRSMKIPLPKCDEQERIISIVDAVTTHCKKLETVHKSQQTLKKSLMHDLLSGSVRVVAVKQLALFK